MLHRRFVAVAKEFGDKVAFVDCLNKKQILYSKALVASLLLTGRFRNYEEGFLGVMLPTTPGCSLAIIAALMSGRTPVMINYSTGAEANIRYARNKCGFRTVITSRAFIEKIGCPEQEDMVFLEDIMAGLTLTEKLKALVLSKLPAPFIYSSIYKGSDDDTAVILFTSGSEKDPKAVQLTHKNILSNVRDFCAAFSISTDDRMLANLPFFHVFGLTVNMWAPLCNGMTIIAYPNPLEFKIINGIIRDEKPTLLIGTPSFLWGYLRMSREGDYASLRAVVSGADKCPDSLRQAFLEKHGLTVYEGYGTTETSPAVSLNTPEHNRPGSIGRVIPNVKVRIENYETGEECALGETGRILVKGDLVMKGYLDDFEETSMRIRHGWYDTGDMGYLDADGYLWHAGRLRRFVKIGGEMVSLVKVEDVLHKFLPPDTHCCVVEVPEALKGAKIVAVVTQSVDERKVLRQMADHLPNIALPRQFIVMEELPRMGSGKIDFRSVTEIVHDRVVGRIRE